MSEDGVNAGARSIGRFFLFAIPAVLGLAAAAWLGVYIDAHNFNHQLSQEDRAAIYAGAQVRPTSKMAVTIKPHDCTHIVHADVDGTSLTLDAKNDCHKTTDYLEWHWKEQSPNGLVIHQGYTNQCGIPDPGETAECKMDVDDDDRSLTMQVWTDARQ